MAIKKHRPSPLEEPPSASSSSEEEDSFEEGSSEEEAEENPSGSDSESGSESESNSELINNTNAAKPLASKPMENNDDGTDSDSKQRSKKKDVGKSLAYTEMMRFNDEIGLSGLNMGAMKRGMELIGESDDAMLAERWKKLRIAEMEVFNTRAKLVRNLTASIIEAYKNSN